MLTNKNFVAYSTTLVGLLLIVSLVMAGGAATFAQGEPVPEQLARTTAFEFHVDYANLEDTIDTSDFSPPSPDPAGITYLTTADTVPQDRLQISDSEVNEMPIYDGANLFETTLSGSLTYTATTLVYYNDSTPLGEPTGVAFDPGATPDDRRFFISDDDLDRVFEVDPGVDGRFGGGDDTVQSFATDSYSNDPEGITYNPTNGYLYIVDGLGRSVHAVDPSDGEDEVSSFDVSIAGLIQPEGIAYNPDGDTLFVLDSQTAAVAEIAIHTDPWVVVRIIDISDAPLYHPGGLAYVPSSASASENHLFIADRGVDNDIDPGENDGKVFEMSFPAITPGNLPPVVSAGPDQTVSISTGAILAGSATDDGEPDPPGSLTTTWSQVSGPGMVTFADDNDPTTTASFSEVGIYVLKLVADDGDLAPSDDVIITVTGDGTEIATEIRVNASSDDAEELFTGGMRLISNNLDMMGDYEFVGIRFNGIPIPQGAAIEKAYIQFQVENDTTRSASLTISGEASDNAQTFVDVNGNISSRSQTAENAAWDPAPWPTVGEAGPDQRTVDIAPIIEEIVGRPGWSRCNSLVLIIEGSGARIAESYDGLPAGAPLLHLYRTGGGTPLTNGAPCVDAGSDQTLYLTNAAALAGFVSDDGLPDPPSAVTTAWSKVSGPGDVTFADASALATTATFSQGGVYVLRLTANDGALSATDDVTITLNQAPVVDAGPDQALSWPDDSTIVDGTVTDDGLPDPPASVTTTWSKVSGPGDVTFDDTSALSTTVSFSGLGSYVLRLTADDGELTSSDDMTVTVATNLPPVIDAGLDQIVSWPDSAILDGTATDDGVPNPPGVVATTWSLVTGPGVVTFTNASAVDTTASFSEVGDYVLRLTGDDGELTSSDDMTVTVTLNRAPVVDAGPDQSLIWPSSANLDGTVTDDGLPDPPSVVTTTWSMVSGPGVVTFTNASSLDTTADFSEQGAYVLRLAADDGQLTASDDIAIHLGTIDVYLPLVINNP
jgi:hypothetical protein